MRNNKNTPSDFVCHPSKDGNEINENEQANSPLSEGCDFSRGVFGSSQSENSPEENRNGVFTKYKKLPYNPKLKERAKKLRKSGNLSEVLFWNQVKRKKFLTLDFHRQKIIGNYIVDFYCPALDLVVEIDGNSHDFKVEYDKIREKYLKSLGLNIIHFDVIDIKKNLNSVMKCLKEYCDKILNTPSLCDSPQEEDKNTPSLCDTLQEEDKNTPSLRDSPQEENKNTPSLRDSP